MPYNKTDLIATNWRIIQSYYQIINWYFFAKCGDCIEKYIELGVKWCWFLSELGVKY